MKNSEFKRKAFKREIKRVNGFFTFFKNIFSK